MDGWMAKAWMQVEEGRFGPPARAAEHIIRLRCYLIGKWSAYPVPRLATPHAHRHPEPYTEPVVACSGVQCQKNGLFLLMPGRFSAWLLALSVSFAVVAYFWSFHSVSSEEKMADKLAPYIIVVGGSYVGIATENQTYR